MFHVARCCCGRPWVLAVSAALTAVLAPGPADCAIVFTTNPAQFPDPPQVTFESLVGASSGFFALNSPLNAANAQNFVPSSLGDLTVAINGTTAPAPSTMFSATGLTNTSNSPADIGNFASRVVGSRGDGAFGANSLDLLFNTPVARVAFDAYLAYGAIPTTGNLIVNVFNSSNVLLGTTTITASNNAPTFVGLFSNSPDANEITRVSLLSATPSALGEAVDNIEVATVPEPSSLALVGLCASGFAGYRLRRRKASGSVAE